MLDRWLSPKTVDWFLASHFQVSPYACPGSAGDGRALLDWTTVERVLASQRPLDLLTVARGRLVDVPRPRTLSDVRRLMQAGISVVVRSSEQHDAGMLAVAEGFAKLLPGEVHVQLYITPADTNSYGWHYDFEDVFIAQTAGVKDYYFRANTVARDTVLGDWLDFARVREETSPLLASQLVAGDWLYLPSRWWHLVKCRVHALSISVGVMPPAAFRAAKQVPAGWSGASFR